MARTFELTTPLGAGVLLLWKLEAREALGQVGHWKLDLLSAAGDIAMDDILARNVTVTMELPGDAMRHLNGYVTRFAQAGMRGRFHHYEATVHAWPWFLSRTADCRIFQNMDVPAILRKVFQDHPYADVDWRLTADYGLRDYTVQYRETDLDFVLRLMEEEGLYFFFRHVAGRHTMVIADAYAAHEPCPGFASVPYVQAERTGRLDAEYMHGWRIEREVRPGRFVTGDHDFTRPSVHLAAQAAQPRGNDYGDGEVFDWPGRFVAAGEGTQLARARLEELQATYETATARTNARGLAAGGLFKLTGHPRDDQNREYLVVSTDLALEDPGHESAEAAGAAFDCALTVLEARQPYRPARITRRPFVQGPQTAVVVGPSGEEIHTDQYGRVKVQFRWDRYGKADENSSCWLRVSQPWAGKNFGMVAIPRVGQEVIVDFLEGDPDRPIVTGRVHNAEQMPPYELPANKTRTGIVTRASMQGTPANANEIRFEDRKGEEQLLLHAERDHLLEVEHDETATVGNDRTRTVGHDETVEVKHDHAMTIGNDERRTVSADRITKVGGDEHLAVDAARNVKVANDDALKVGKALVIDAGDSVTIRSGSASLMLKSDGTVIINGREVTMSGASQVTVKSGGSVTVKGAKVMQN